MPISAARRIHVPESAQVARAFLADLRQVHRDLLACILHLETMACQVTPERSALTNARWKLGQASLARRLLATRICDYLDKRCDPGTALHLQELRQADRDMLKLSAAHLGKWSADSIYEDWEGYCHEGRAIRRRAHDHVALEQRLLYPLLEQVVRRI